jgi:Xaa-Pro aminopeptidase
MTVARLRDWLAAEGADAAVITKPASVAYLTGVFVNPHERLLALAITAGDALLVLPALDRERAAATLHSARLAGYDDGVDGVALLPHLGETVAVEKDGITLGLAERLGPRRLLDAAPEIRRLRMRKTPEELELLLRAAEITDAVCDATLDFLRPGLSELEVAGHVLQLIAEAGAEPSFDPLIQSGPNSAFPHGRPTARRLETGDLVLVDIGAAWRGYKADITRMAVIGEPDERQRKLHAWVLAAHDAGLEAVAPGVKGADVDAAARGVLDDAGEGERFIHRTGHGLGLEDHEDPNFAPGDETALEPGMVATVEPGVYVPGWGGIRIEDDVVVEAASARSLTKLRRDLRIINATP